MVEDRCPIGLYDNLDTYIYRLPDHEVGGQIRVTLETANNWLEDAYVVLKRPESAIISIEKSE